MRDTFLGQFFKKTKKEIIIFLVYLCMLVCIFAIFICCSACFLNKSNNNSYKRLEVTSFMSTGLADLAGFKVFGVHSLVGTFTLGSLVAPEMQWE